MHPRFQQHQKSDNDMNKYQYKVQGVDYDVEIEEVEGNVAKVNVNGIRFDVELKQPINPTSTLKKVHVEAPKPVARPTVAPRTTSSQNMPEPSHRLLSNRVNR